jgi:hypothetical protein
MTPAPTISRSGAGRKKELTMYENEIAILRDGNKICALVGPNLQEGLAGFGDTAAEALRELAQQVEEHGYNFVNL